MAVRPKTLTLALVPVVVGSALAWHDGAPANWLVFAVTLISACCIQAGTNLFNDASDAERGNDGPERLGPKRVTGTGMASAGQVKRSAGLAFLLAFAGGIYLAVLGGWPIVAIGIASLLAGWAYSGGRKPLAYTPWGEVFVIGFFGVLAVAGSYYLQAGGFSPKAPLIGVVLGLPAAAVLLLNNLRDHVSDRRAGRHTLVHLTGTRAAYWLYAVLMLAPFPLLVWILPATTLLAVWAALPFFAWLVWRAMRLPPSPAMNRQLALTALAQVLFGGLLAASLLLPDVAAGPSRVVVDLLSRDGMIEKLLPLALAFIMFSLGLGLRLDDFRRALRRPQAILAGLLAQTVLLPLSGFLIALGFNLPPEGAVGLMVLAACPGGVTAGMVTYLARGETALSISLSAITSLLSFITVPLIVGASLVFFLDRTTAVDVPAGQLAGGLLVVTLLPVGLGLWLNESARLSERSTQYVHRAATFVFIAIVAYTFLHEWPSITHHLPDLGPACLTLNLVTMATGALLATATRLRGGERIALTMECGIQNSALGITLALSLLAQPVLAIPSVIYAVLMNVTAIAFIAWRRWQVVESPA